MQFLFHEQYPFMFFLFLMMRKRGRRKLMCLIVEGVICNSFFISNFSSYLHTLFFMMLKKGENWMISLNVGLVLRESFTWILFWDNIEKWGVYLNLFDKRNLHFVCHHKKGEDWRLRLIPCFWWWTSQNDNLG
mgnify:CR=1 FL=1